MKKATILKAILNGGKILKGLKLIKEVWQYAKALIVILGSSLIVNVLNFLNGFSWLESGILNAGIMVGNVVGIIYTIVIGIKIILKLIPVVKEIIENPITQKVVKRIKEKLKKDDDIIIDAEPVEED